MLKPVLFGKKEVDKSDVDDYFYSSEQVVHNRNKKQTTFNISLDTLSVPLDFEQAATLKTFNINLISNVVYSIRNNLTLPNSC